MAGSCNSGYGGDRKISTEDTLKNTEHFTEIGDLKSEELKKLNRVTKCNFLWIKTRNGV